MHNAYNQVFKKNKVNVEKFKLFEKAYMLQERLFEDYMENKSQELSEIFPGINLRCLLFTLVGEAIGAFEPKGLISIIS